MTLLTIDSSVYLSALILKDPFHSVSHRFLEKVKKEGCDIVLPALVPLEVANILFRQGLPAIKSLQVYESFYATPKVRILAMDRAFGEVLLKKIGKFDLKTADWIIAATCLELGATLITWDKQLLQKTKGLLGTKTPAA